jgi:hypothetical protein
MWLIISYRYSSTADQYAEGFGLALRIFWQTALIAWSFGGSALPSRFGNLMQSLYGGQPLFVIHFIYS